MKNKSWIIVSTLIVSCFSNWSAHAQATGSHGGSYMEVALKDMLQKLSVYLNSRDGKKAFEVVVAYDKTHPNETVEQVAVELNPHLVDHLVFDDQGHERDCVSGTDLDANSGKVIRYFTCNQNKLPSEPISQANDKIKGSYYQTLYQLVFHEVLVQVGIEAPLSQEVPSEYPYASKLEVHLEDIPVWMPGGAAKCSNCETIPTDLLYRPLREVLPISHLKLRLKKEIYLNDAGGSVFLGSSQRCYISFLQKYKGKVVSCDNTDGSPREFFISKKDIKIHNGATENGVTREQIDINPHLPLEEESDYELPGGISLRHTAHIQCAGDNTTTVQQLIDDLSPYYELENSSDLSAPRI